MGSNTTCPHGACPLGTRPGGALSAMFYAYIVKSLKDQRFYYGSTADLDRRIKNHNG